MFSGKVAVVTGASSGIGRSTAVGLGAEGARVGVHYRSDHQGAHDTVAAVESAGGSGFILQADFAETGAAQALWSAFDAHADAVDIVVDNAGCPSKGGINAATEAEFDDLFAVNLRTPLFIIQHALPRMADGGRIINVTSIGTLGGVAAGGDVPGLQGRDQLTYPQPGVGARCSQNYRQCRGTPG
jgi:3-oxoacyl-[acyl-carrier protein] reductase